MTAILALLAQIASFPGAVQAPAYPLDTTQPGLNARAPFVNVRAAPYFADNTGATSALVAIQACINSGKRCYLPDGTYLITDTITLPTGATVVGAGINNTTITCPACANFHHIFNGATVSDVDVSDMSLVGPGGANDIRGINTTACTRCRFERLKISAGSVGIDILGGSVDSVVADNTISGMNTQGMEILGDRNTIRDNRIDTIGSTALHHGIYVHAGDGNQLLFNRISNVYGFCVHLYDGVGSPTISNVRVAENQCLNGGLASSGTRGCYLVWAGTATATTKQIVLSTNSCDNAGGGTPFYIQAVSDSTFTGNVARTFQGDGFVIQGASGYNPAERIDLTGNVLASGTVSGNGISITANSGTVRNLTVVGNNLNSVYAAGIRTQGLTDSLISGNRIKDYNAQGNAGNSGIRVESTSLRNIVSGNQVSTVNVTGSPPAIQIVAAADADNQVFGNLLANNASGISDSGTRTLVFGNKANTTDSIFQIPGAVTIGGQTNIGVNLASDVIGIFSNANAGGFGLAIKNGNDTNYGLSIESSGGANNINLYGNGNIDQVGTVTKYKNITTAGIGLVPVLGSAVSLTGQVANLAATNVYAAAPVGDYRVCVNARTTTSGTGTTATLNIIWTDEGGVKTDAIGTWALNSVTFTGQLNKCEYIHAAAATNIQVSVTAGTYGTSAYAISATAERLN